MKATLNTRDSKDRKKPRSAPWYIWVLVAATVLLAIGLFLLWRDRGVVLTGDKYDIFRDLLYVILALALGSGLAVYGIVSYYLRRQAETLWQRLEQALAEKARRLEREAYDGSNRRVARVLYQLARSLWQYWECMFGIGGMNTGPVRKDFMMTAIEIAKSAMSYIDRIQEKKPEDHADTARLKHALAHYYAEVGEPDYAPEAYRLVEESKPSEEDPATAANWYWFETKAYVLRKFRLHRDDLTESKKILAALLARKDIEPEEIAKMKRRHSIRESQAAEAWEPAD